MGKDARVTEVGEVLSSVRVDASDAMLHILRILAEEGLCRVHPLDITPLDVTIAPAVGEGAAPGPLDPWAWHPLKAALAELADPEHKNKLAICARLYAMRFDVDAYPFEWARMGKLVKSISGGHVRLCQFIWRCGIENVRGDPMDYITAALSKESRVPLTSSVTPVSDPQAAALARARENQRRVAEHAMTGE